MSRMTALRCLACALGGVALGLVAGRAIGTTLELGSIVAAPIGASGGLLAARRGRARWVRRLVLGAVATVVSAALAAVVAEGRLVDGPLGLVRGPRQILTTEWPSPRWPTIVAALGGLVCVATFVAVAMAADSRWRVAPVLPLVLGAVALAGSSAPSGALWILAPTCAAVACALALLRPGRSARLSIRSLLGLATAVALASAVAVINIDADRRDPRSLRPPDDELAVLDPVGDTLAQASADASIELFRVSVPDGELPAFWRTAGLDRYDGQAWRLGDDFRPLGGQVDEARGAPVQQVQLDVLRSDQRLIVSPGRVVTSDMSLRSDAERSLYTIDPGDRPLRVDLGTVVAGQVEAGSNAGLAQVTPSDIEETFTQTARTLAGTGTLPEQIDQLAARLVEDYTLDDSVGGGLQLTLIDLFVNDTRVGTTEQFVTAFVLMARSLGVDARLATGYVIEPDGASEATIVTSDAAMWAEVRLASGEYLTIDVTPLARQAVEPPALPDQGQAPPAVQPPEPPQTEQAEDDDEQVEVDRPEVTTWWDRVRPYAVGAAFGAAGVIAATCLFVLVVVFAKARRRRGLHSGVPSDRIHRAWLVAADELVDADVDLDDNVTTADISSAGARAFPQIEAPIDTLSSLADRAVFSAKPCEPEHADFAVALLADVQTGLRKNASVRERVRRTISPRSLSRRRGSPLRRRQVASNRRGRVSRRSARR